MNAAGANATTSLLTTGKESQGFERDDWLHVNGTGPPVTPSPRRSRVNRAVER